ncbi:MAG: T9SS type A sorting domain-containing protein [Bacteroidota bacterium]
MPGSLPVERGRFLCTPTLLAGFYKTDADTQRIISSTDNGQSWFEHSKFVTSSLSVGNESLAGKEDSLFLLDRSGDNWKLLRSFDRGYNWDSVGRVIPIVGSRNNILATSDSILHEVHRYRFDSAGQVYDLVVQYMKSTDWGETWSDSVSLSTVATQVANEPYIATDVSQTGTTILAVWKDGKYGCLALGGCAILGRVSHANGEVWGPELRFDQNAAGGLPIAVVSGSTMIVVWTDINDVISQLIKLTLSQDGGMTWCAPIVVDTGSAPKIVIRGSDLHIVWHRTIGPTIRTYYKKGLVLPTSVKESPILPKAVTLQQNYPNPFNPTTIINYQQAASNWVTLKVFDLLGREVATLVNEKIEVGEHSVEWNAERLPSGVYYYRLISGNRAETRKAVLIR